MKLSFQKNDNKWDVLYFNFEIFERKIDKNKPKNIELAIVCQSIKKEFYLFA